MSDKSEFSNLVEIVWSESKQVWQEIEWNYSYFESIISDAHYAAIIMKNGFNKYAEWVNCNTIHRVINKENLSEYIK